MILTRRFGGLRMHKVVTPSTEESKVQAIGDIKPTTTNTDIPAAEQDRVQQRPAA